MSDDPLAQFRRNQSAPKAADTPAVSEGRGPYRAFAGKDNQRRARLDIRRKDGMAHAVGYNFIIEITYDRRGYTAILLVLSTMLVKVKGKRLRPIVDALKLGTCEYIQEFDAEEFDPPEDAGGPVVDSIEVISAAEQRQQAKRD
jgi:hypothetical protein